MMREKYTNTFFNKKENQEERAKTSETPYKYTQKAKGNLHHYINDEIEDVLAELHDGYSDSDYSSEDDTAIGDDIPSCGRNFTY